MENKSDKMVLDEIKKENIQLIKDFELKTEEDWEKALELEKEGKAIILLKEEL